MRIIFMGTPDFAVPALRALHEAGHEIVACYCQPPRPGGRRGLSLTKSPVHQAAEALGIDVYTPLHFKELSEQERFQSFNADIAVVAAYGLILPQAVLDAPRWGCLNIHASLLPRWRGAAPIHRAIMAGDAETGVTIMQMEAGLDTGPMGLRETLHITPQLTTGMAHDQLAEMGGRLIIKAVQAVEAGELDFEPQPETGITYAKKIDKAEAEINWHQNAEAICRQVHGLSPFPGAWTMMVLNGKAQRVKVLSASLIDQSGAVGTVLNASPEGYPVIACGTQALALKKLQRAGSAPMDGIEFRRGANIESVVV